MLSAPGGTCPYCGQLAVKVLDHNLSKRPHGVLSTVPQNLVPCCRDCNTEKLDRAYPDKGRQPLHPYFDNFDDEQWLAGLVRAQDGVVIEFYVSDPSSWDPERVKRTKYHFNLFKLSKLFTVLAATELVNVKQRLIELHASGGAEGVRLHLADEARSRAAAFVNSWQTAMYQAIAGHSDFCDGGFNSI
jgi:hypothetical protein